MLQDDAMQDSMEENIHEKVVQVHQFGAAFVSGLDTLQAGNHKYRRRTRAPIAIRRTRAAPIAILEKETLLKLFPGFQSF